jgi:hypothetical protein
LSKYALIPATSLNKCLQLFFLLVLANALNSCGKGSEPLVTSNVADGAKINSRIAITDIANEENDRHNLSDGEPSIAVNPQNPLEIAIVAFSGEWGLSSSQAINAPIWRSTDGGRSWKKDEIVPPPPPFFPLGPKGKSVNLLGPTDQHIAFDSQGALVITVLGSFNDAHINENYAYREAPGSHSLVPLGKEFGNSVADQPNVAASLNQTECSDKVLSAWNRTDVYQAMETSTSIKGSPNNESGVGDISSYTDRSARIAASRDGRAYLVFKTIEGSLGQESHKTHFVVKASDDCGITWSALPGKDGVPVHGSEPIETLFTTDFGHLLQKGLQVQARALSSDDWIATDPVTGEVYVAYLRKDAKGLTQVMVAHSKDRGNSWESSKVTDGPYQSAYPEVAVAGNSTVGVLFIEAEEFSDRTIFNHRFARSFDHGRSWTTKTLQSMDPATLDEIKDNPGENSNEILWGDYEGLVARGPIFFGVFTGSSIGRRRSQLDPIFFKATALSSLDDSTVR